MNTGDALRGSGVGYVKRGQRHEHRRVMETILGRSLASDEIVHHIDGNKQNNAAENLKLMSRAEHIAAHRAEMIAARKCQEN